MSRTVVFLKPRSANSCAAIASSSSRRPPDAFPVIDPDSARSAALGGSGVLAADTDHLAGQVRRVVARQEHHHVGDLPGFCRAAEGLALLELVEQLVGGHLGEEG